MSIEFVREGSRIGHRKTSMLPYAIIKLSSRIGNDPGKKLLRNLENGATVGYESDLRSPPPKSYLAKQNRESTMNNVVFWVTIKLF